MTTTTTEALALALEQGMRSLASCAIEAETGTEPVGEWVDAAIRLSRPGTPLGLMRDALAAHRAAPPIECPVCCAMVVGVAAPAHSQPQDANTADDLREPKNGEAWRVHWWNESARLMLPASSKLDSFQAYKNGTLMFTIKREVQP